MAKERILVADAQDSLRRGIVRALSETGHDVEEVANGNAAIEKLHVGQFDVIVCDLKMGGSDGLDVLRTTKALHPNTAVILMTAFGSIQTAVEAMQMGAFDYVQKPFEIEEMELKIDKALEHRRLKHEIDYLRHTQPDIYDFDRIVGASGALQRVLDIVRKVAKTNTTVLIRGETGTGKELIAGALHHNSLRANRNLVRVNCAALQENLLESELFGHEKGAFTGADHQRIGRFEQADAGSLFLDEVGDMSANTQAKILRVLQEQEFERLGGTRAIRVDVRLIAASNRNLAEMVSRGEFREDLYYRLNVMTVTMPPLRERKEDISALALTFLRRFCRELQKSVTRLDSGAEKLLQRYNWPGNIRELENSIERAVLLADGEFITKDDLRLGELSTTSDGAGPTNVVKIPPSGVALEEIERQAVIEALTMSNWIQKDAAELLSISPRVMNYKIKTLGITLPRQRRTQIRQP
jgi:DNA-binding NtrC family response regulator